MARTVVVDDREPTSVVDAVAGHPDVDDVEVRRLTAGDVVLGEVGIERKTLADYASTLLARSGPDLYDQVERLIEAYEHAYVLLEDDLPADEHEGVPAAAIRGSVASFTARLGAPVIPCSDRARLVDLAVRLGSKHVDDPSTRALPSGAVTARREPVAKRMYGCIEGIGPETAARIHEVYPSVAELVDASPEELLAIEGIGPTRAKAVYEAFRAPEEPPLGQ